MATDHGQQAIGTLHVGTKVLAYNPKTHKMEQEPVLHVWVHSDNDLIDLTITTATKGQHGKSAHTTREVVHTNQKHPFLTIERGFLPVGQIAVGMHVRRADGKVGVITGWKIVPGAKTMYNLEVAQDHTFTVGDGQWVVHNCGETFPNRLPQHLESELKTAKDLGVKPLRVGEPGFQKMIQDGTVKWAVTKSDGLKFIPKWVDGQELAHTVITGGEDVLSAGEANIFNTGNGYRATSFNTWSGHYRPSDASSLVGIEAFQSAGIDIPPPI
ncbi:MAG: hypothetical protein H0U76_15915 [Ktedonobacteraceae bacterium]|nr:hypothetical protein [Ktedonobacteraceae bacterium]